jgi:hypothetical protein
MNKFIYTDIINDILIIIYLYSKLTETSLDFSSKSFNTSYQSIMSFNPPPAQNIIQATTSQLIDCNEITTTQEIDRVC